MPDARREYRIGVDVGGTFTDCVLARPDGSVRLEKSPTTRGDQSNGVLAGIELLAMGEGLTLPELLARTATIVHGTTTGDNTMIEMSGAPTGLICTEGFRDEMDIRRGFKEDIWDAALPAPEPIVRRRVRISIPERLDADGNVVVPLDEEAVRKAAARLRAFGIESIAISFLHSFVNPAHEVRAREIVLDEYPDVSFVTMSHEVLPRAPEFERTSTTVVNAYVGPVITRYVRSMEARLRDAGLTSELLIARSNGGVCQPSVIQRRAVATIGSGPTGGAVAAAAIANAAGLRDVVSVDMGGTSYDVCLTRDGRPDVKTEWNWHHRYLIQLPMVDVQSVGAGGGSIARVAGDRLLVGPQSAGANPGPACYGLGGTEATVTDADLVLGRIDAGRFAAGRRALDVDAARAALARLGAPLGLGAEQAAVAVVEVVDAYMADAVRRVCAVAGVDPRSLAIVAFGGMGPVHVTTQASALGMHRCLVPLAASAFSAFGLLMADHVFDESRSYLAPCGEVDLDELGAAADSLDALAKAEMRDAGVSEEQVERVWFLNMVFPGQTFDVAIPLAHTPGARISAHALRGAVEEFHRRNAEARLIESRAEEPLVRGIRLVATGRTRHPSLTPPSAPDTAQPRGRRRVHLAGEWLDADVVDIATVVPGSDAVTGPAVIELAFSSLVLRPGDTAQALDSGDLVVDLSR